MIFWTWAHDLHKHIYTHIMIILWSVYGYRQSIPYIHIYTAQKQCAITATTTMYYYYDYSLLSILLRHYHSTKLSLLLLSRIRSDLYMFNHVSIVLRFIRLSRSLHCSAARSNSRPLVNDVMRVTMITCHGTFRPNINTHTRECFRERKR